MTESSAYFSSKNDVYLDADEWIVAKKNLANWTHYEDRSEMLCSTCGETIIQESYLEESLSLHFEQSEIETMKHYVMVHPEIIDSLDRLAKTIHGDQGRVVARIPKSSLTYIEIEKKRPSFWQRLFGRRHP